MMRAGRMVGDIRPGCGYFEPVRVVRWARAGFVPYRETGAVLPPSLCWTVSSASDRNASPPGLP